LDLVVPKGPNLSLEGVASLNGVLVPRGVKIFARSLRRAVEKAEFVTNGKRQKKRYIPQHLRGLTTQEFHEVCKRELDDKIAWIHERGYKALSRDAILWYKSYAAQDWRYRIIQIGVSNELLSRQEWEKFLNHLATYGCPNAIHLPYPIRSIELERRAREKSFDLRQKQKVATSDRVFVKGKGMLNAIEASRSSGLDKFTLSARKPEVSSQTWDDIIEEQESDDYFASLPTFDF
jgi:hypothetical protein